MNMTIVQNKDGVFEAMDESKYVNVLETDLENMIDRTNNQSELLEKISMALLIMVGDEYPSDDERISGKLDALQLITDWEVLKMGES